MIWVDEASLLYNQDMAALFDVAEQVQCPRDPDGRPAAACQRRSRGSPLRLLEEEAGVPSVAVTEIMRQQGDVQEGGAAAVGGQDG